MHNTQTGTCLPYEHYDLLNPRIIFSLSQVMDAQTPFMFKGGEGVNAGIGDVEWVVAKER